MSVEADKCNVEGCKGYVVFENADFDFNNFNTNKTHGVWTFAEPTCSECEKEFLVVPDYSVIDAKDLWNGEYEYLESACITAFENREKEIKT
ncbi:hypothetical protein [Sporosarcina jiandibaonis]|uniref:hypothetical protein n=1 Tax=Sporosarcina jiandibaonis TaxID=2715535 RepID=UPI0015567F61|nr:hypothetical protein [Sporosarcina jiandibaonis]